MPGCETAQAGGGLPGRVGVRASYARGIEKGPKVPNLRVFFEAAVGVPLEVRTLRSKEIDRRAIRHFRPRQVSERTADRQSSVASLRSVRTSRGAPTFNRAASDAPTDRIVALNAGRALFDQHGPVRVTTWGSPLHFQRLGPVTQTFPMECIAQGLQGRLASVVVIQTDGQCFCLGKFTGPGQGGYQMPTNGRG